MSGRKKTKREQILDGAREVFMSHGFGGSSVDRIARAAGVSKATLYAYFSSKPEIFAAIVQRECAGFEAIFEEVVASNARFDMMLRQLARQFVTFLVQPMTQGIYRLVVAEGQRFPELGLAFYEAGPGKMSQHLSDAFLRAAEAGALVVEDFELAAQQFGHMCHAVVFHRALFFPDEAITPADIERVAEGAFETFMARYGVAA